MKFNPKLYQRQYPLMRTKPISAKLYHRLTMRQKMLVNKLRKHGLKAVAYKRGNKFSVHSPILSAKRMHRMIPLSRKTK